MNGIVTHFNPQIRICGLELLTECTSRTLDITAVDIELIKRFLIIESSQSVDTRNKITYLMKHYFERIKRLIYSDMKAIKNLKRKLQNDEVKAEIQIRNDSIILKCNFLQWVHRLNMYSLFPGSSFQRRAGHLDLLDAQVEIEGKSIEPNAILRVEDVKNYKVNITKSDFQALFSVFLFETFEQNRFIAFKHVKSCKFGDIEVYLARLPLLLSSLRAAEVDTGAYLAKYVYSNVQSKVPINFLGVRCDIRDESFTDQEVYIANFLANLKYCIDESIANLTYSSQYRPMNGVISALRQILQDCGAINPILLRALIDLCVKASQSVLKVCSDSSPGN
jgi:hypothetical protein